MNELSETITRLAPLKFVGLACAFVGIWAAVGIAVADLQGLPYRYWMRYVVFLERKLRLLFIWTSGSRIATGQAIALFVVLALYALADLPYWWAFVILILIGPAVYIERLRRQRVLRIERQFDGFLVALSNALKATPSLGDAFISTQALVRPPLQEEISLAIKEMRVGSTLDQAILLMGTRIGSRHVDSALSALLIGRQIGGNLPKILDSTSSALREMARLEAVVRTKTAEGKAQLSLLSLFPFLLVFAFTAVKENYFEPLTQSIVGYLIILIAGVCWAFSLLLARKIVSVDI